MTVTTLCLSGLDGSGKTTQLEELRDRLSRLGYNVRYVHHFGAERHVAGVSNQQKWDCDNLYRASLARV